MHYSELGHLVNWADAEIEHLKVMRDYLRARMEDFDEDMDKLAKEKERKQTKSKGA